MSTAYVLMFASYTCTNSFALGLGQNSALMRLKQFPRLTSGSLVLWMKA